MTTAHLLYIPTVFLLGMVFGALIAERGREKSTGDRPLSDSPRLGISKKVLLLAFLIFLGTFVITHLFPVPYGSKMVERALGGLALFDKQPSFSATEVYARLQSYSLEGLPVYKKFTYTIDVIFPISLFYFLITLSRFAFQRTYLPASLAKVVLVFPVIWIGFDLLENSMVFTLLSQFPDRINFLGSLLGWVTAIKFGLLFLSILSPVWLIFLRKRHRTL
jgi:hypothetical protein